LAKAWRLYGNSDDGGRRGVRLALAAALDYVATADPQAGEMFDRFVTVMVTALDDLDRGIAAPLLKKGARRAVRRTVSGTRTFRTGRLPRWPG